MQKKKYKFNARIFGGAIALAVALAIVVGLAFNRAALAHGDDEKAVRDVLMQDAAAFVTGDVATLNKLWANEEWGRSSRAGEPITGGPATATTTSSRR